MERDRRGGREKQQQAKLNQQPVIRWKLLVHSSGVSLTAGEKQDLHCGPRSSEVKVTHCAGDRKLTAVCGVLRESR